MKTLTIRLNKAESSELEKIMLKRQSKTASKAIRMIIASWLTDIDRIEGLLYQNAKLRGTLETIADLNNKIGDSEMYLTNQKNKLEDLISSNLNEAPF